MTAASMINNDMDSSADEEIAGCLDLSSPKEPLKKVPNSRARFVSRRERCFSTASRAFLAAFYPLFALSAISGRTAPTSAGIFGRSADW